MDAPLFQPLAIALSLGLLVGLQRQWQDDPIAGIRTFPLITLAGALCAALDGSRPGWITAAGVLAVAALLISANFVRSDGKPPGPGMTTEVAAVLMFAVGATLVAGHTGPAVVVTGVTAVLLHYKRDLHERVATFGEKDLRAVSNMVLIGLVILPILPDTTYGPYDVFNPYEVWLMVVLIVGISLTAYVVYRLGGTTVGTVLGGLLGGLISSTATTVSYARQSKAREGLAASAAMVILLASTVVNGRILVEIGVVAPALLAMAALPLLILMATMIVQCVILFLKYGRDDSEPPDQDNPAQLKPALIFGLLYVVVLFIVAAVKDFFGTQALYGVAVVSGLTDVDAMTLSTARLYARGDLAAPIAWRVIMVANLANLGFKAGAVAFLGSRKCFAYVAVTFAIAIGTGLALLFLWPDLELSFIVANFMPQR